MHRLIEYFWPFGDFRAAKRGTMMRRMPLYGVRLVGFQFATGIMCMTHSVPVAVTGLVLAVFLTVIEVGAVVQILRYPDAL